MKIKELIKELEAYNPEKEIEFRAYTDFDKNSCDLKFNDIRVSKGKIVVSNQGGVY